MSLFYVICLSYTKRTRFGMCLILQEIVFQDQVLKTCKSVQDSSVENMLENTCLYRIQNKRSRKINGSTSFAIGNTYYVSF